MNCRSFNRLMSRRVRYRGLFEHVASYNALAGDLDWKPATTRRTGWRSEGLRCSIWSRAASASPNRPMRESDRRTAEVLRPTGHAAVE